RLVIRSPILRVGLLQIVVLRLHLILYLILYLIRLIVLDVDDVAHIRMLAQPLGDLLLGAWTRSRKNAVLARDQPQRTRLRGQQQSLRLADGHARTEEDGDTARPKERSLL